MTLSGKFKILGAIIICTTIISAIFLHTVKGGQAVFELNEKIIRDIVHEYVGVDLPTEKLSASITSDGILCFNAVISSEKLLNMLENNIIEFSNEIELISKLLPDRTKVLFELKVSFDASKKKLILTPVRFAINDIDISPQLLPPILNSGLCDAINIYLTQNGIMPNGIEVRNGSIIFSE